MATDSVYRSLGSASDQLSTVYIQSLGCAPNQADGVRISEFLSAHGWTVVSRPEEATAAVVLTCGFTGEAEAANLDRLRQVRSLLPSGARLFIGGCLPAIAGPRLGSLSEGAFLFSPRDIPRLEAEFSRAPSAMSSSSSKRSEVSRRIVRISTGCMSKCTFCAIPQAAGQTRSRSVEEIAAEIRSCVEAGIREFRLTSEDVSAYGRDIGTTCVTLVRTILETTEAESIALDTLNPKWLHSLLPELLPLLRDSRIDRRLYIPIQSASDDVLRRMGRGYTASHVHGILTRLLREVPDIRLSTDFLVGFPGETDADFQLTREMLSAFPFRFLEVFRYAPRSGTPAANFGNRIPLDVADARARLLLSDFLEAELDRVGVGEGRDVLSYLENTHSLPVNTNVLGRIRSRFPRVETGFEEDFDG